MAKQHQGAHPLSWGGRWREEGLSLDATNDRIHRLICKIEGEKYRQRKPITVGGRTWSTDTVRDAVKEYSTNEDLRELVDQSAADWTSIFERHLHRDKSTIGGWT